MLKTTVKRFESHSGWGFAFDPSGGSDIQIRLTELTGTIPGGTEKLVGKTVLISEVQRRQRGKRAKTWQVAN